MMLTGIFDYHAHYDDPKFDGDRAQVLARVHEGGVEYIINAGADLETSRSSIRLAEEFPFVYAVVGVHPQDAQDAPEDYLARLEEMAAHPKVVGIGEIGLDYHYTREHIEAQHRVFEGQLQLAARLGLPVVIHDWDAHEDTMKLLRRHRPAGVMHCYSGSAEMAKELLRLGLYLGFTGSVTYKGARRALESAAAAPLDRILTETDAPYQTPEPFRGKRCDSGLLPYTIRTLADIKGVDPQEMARIAGENARRLFGI